MSKLVQSPRLHLSILPQHLSQGRYGHYRHRIRAHAGTAPVRIEAARCELRSPKGYPVATQSWEDAAALFGINDLPPGAAVTAECGMFADAAVTSLAWMVSARTPEGSLVGAQTEIPLHPYPDLDLFLFTRDPRREAVIYRPSAPGPHPALILSHGRGASAASYAWAAQEAARHGIVGMAISHPGFGGSEGQRDGAGPDSAAAVLAAVDWLQNEPAVDPNRIALWGMSRGAQVTALAAAAAGGKVWATILQAGAYNAALFLKTTRPEVAIQVRKEGTPEGLAKNSPLLVASQIRCPVLMLHGTDDDIATSEHPRQMAREFDASGTPYQLHWIEGAGHTLPTEIIWPRYIIPFLQKQFGITGS